MKENDKRKRGRAKERGKEREERRERGRKGKKERKLKVDVIVKAVCCSLAKYNTKKYTQTNIKTQEINALKRYKSKTLKNL